MATTTRNLSAIGKHFSDEDAARELLESLRWPTGAVCPKCGAEKPYKLTPKATSKAPCRKGVWKCRACRKQFTVTVGTIFEHSHVPISEWLLAIHLLSASKKGMSAHQLHRLLGVTYRAAWFMAHRLRHAMKQDAMQLDGIVEVDETYVGGPRKPRMGTGRPKPNDPTKTPVIALVERGGRVRAFPLARVTGDNVQDVIRREVSLNAHMMSDDLNVYHPLSMGFRKHEVVVHSRNEYVRGDVHTNTVEGFFGLLKRGIIGSFHHVSKGHLARYCDEFCFRYNARKMTDGERAAMLVTAAEGKRLTYAEPKSALA
ncbi:MAG: IS1595 family transposase [Vicinamibacterales bacterium]